MLRRFSAMENFLSRFCADADIQIDREPFSRPEEVSSVVDLCDEFDPLRESPEDWEAYQASKVKSDWKFHFVPAGLTGRHSWPPPEPKLKSCKR